MPKRSKISKKTNQKSEEEKVVNSVHGGGSSSNALDRAMLGATVSSYAYSYNMLANSDAKRTNREVASGVFSLIFAVVGTIYLNSRLKKIKKEQSEVDENQVITNLKRKSKGPQTVKESLVMMTQIAARSVASGVASGVSGVLDGVVDTFNGDNVVRGMRVTKDFASDSVDFLYDKLPTLPTKNEIANSVYEKLPNRPELPSFSRPKLSAVNIFGSRGSVDKVEITTNVDAPIPKEVLQARNDIEPIERKLENSGIVAKQSIEPIEKESLKVSEMVSVGSQTEAFDSPKSASTESQTEFVESKDASVSVNNTRSMVDKGSQTDYFEDEQSIELIEIAHKKEISDIRGEYENKIKKITKGNTRLHKKNHELQKENSNLRGRLEGAEMVIKMADVTKSAPQSPDRPLQQGYIEQQYPHSQNEIFVGTNAVTGGYEYLINSGYVNQDGFPVVQSLGTVPLPAVVNSQQNSATNFGFAGNFPTYQPDSRGVDYPEFDRQGRVFDVDGICYQESIVASSEARVNEIEESDSPGASPKGVEVDKVKDVGKENSEGRQA